MSVYVFQMDLIRCYIDAIINDYFKQQMNSLHQQCAICSNQPEDMLILSCTHNLCLDCATQLFSISSNKNNIQCEICYASTPLDQETIKCLNSLVVRSPVKSNVSSPKYVQPKIPKLPKQIKGLKCHEHKEKALYFCFDCQNGSICSECVLTNVHSGHQILTIKKSVKILKQKLIQNNNNLESIKQKLEQSIQFLKNQKSSLIHDKNEKKNSLKSVFQSIMKQISNKYNDLQSQLQNISLRNIQMTQGSINQLNQKYSFISHSIKQSAQILQKHDEEQIIVKYLQVQLRNHHSYSEQPSSFVGLYHSYELSNEVECTMEISQILNRLKWEQSIQNGEKQNNTYKINIEKDQSFLNITKQKIKVDFEESYKQKDIFNNSVNKYSGIKSSSKRLELSRSMDNATNIINKLQERVRK